MAIFRGERTIGRPPHTPAKGDSVVLGNGRIVPRDSLEAKQESPFGEGGGARHNIEASRGGKKGKKRKRKSEETRGEDAGIKRIKAIYASVILEAERRQTKPIELAKEIVRLLQMHLESMEFGGSVKRTDIQLTARTGDLNKTEKREMKEDYSQILEICRAAVSGKRLTSVRVAELIINELSDFTRKREAAIY